MPTVVQLKFKDGSTDTVKLPVEVWKRNTEWTFKVNSTKEISEVKLDPTNSIPDINLKNNTWSSSQAAPVEKINVKDYTGTFGNKELNAKLTFKEKDNQLFGQAAGQQDFPLEYVGNRTFTFDQAQISMTYSEDKKTITFTQGGREFKFTKE
jgi:hypothetical protein